MRFNVTPTQLQPNSNTVQYNTVQYNIIGEREREKQERNEKKTVLIVATTFASPPGQRTHFARTNSSSFSSKLFNGVVFISCC